MMSDMKNRQIEPAPGSGVFWELTARIKLILKLVADRRVNPLLKALPLASLAYLLVPDLAPGPIDDAMILWLGTYLFVELCPPEVVEEHLKAIQRTVDGKIADKEERPIREEDITDAEYWEEPKP
jgi:hypothetical protein